MWLVYTLHVLYFKQVLKFKDTKKTFYCVQCGNADQSA